MPFYSPRPQPDYSVGFGRSAFTAGQLKKLKGSLSKGKQRVDDTGHGARMCLQSARHP
jgi:hypothetical protein